jgi:hypothetical protein
MVVWKYFYIDINLIARQVTPLRMMKLIATTVYNHHMEGQFHFLAL